MRTPEEKEAIILEYLSGKSGYKTIAAKYGISNKLFLTWIEKYRKNGIEGLSIKPRGGHLNIGKYNRHPTEVEKLKKELLKKEIEIERLKKGYRVKGGGAQKEYVTTFDVNTKS